MILFTQDEIRDYRGICGANMLAMDILDEIETRGLAEKPVKPNHSAAQTPPPEGGLLGDELIRQVQVDDFYSSWFSGEPWHDDAGLLAITL